MDSKKTILIIEDEAPLLGVLTDTLSENGFTVIQTHDGDEGLRLAQERHPDLILLDILMPKMDGMSMMTKLRQDEWGKTVPVVILTNVNPDSDETIKAIVNNQPAYYLVKSDTKLDDIVEKVKEVALS